MAFQKTPAGTRGKSTPGVNSPVFKWINNLMIRRARKSTSGRSMGMNTLVLTTTGAKTGQRRETLLGWFPDGDDAWLIVASFGGNAKNPAWYHNIAAHPDQVEIAVGGRKVKAAWERITAAQSRYAGYATKTDRDIPIIRLTPSPA
jgi:deazaflavin-dependent oxidoreductase (nitroreductase family)